MTKNWKSRASAAVIAMVGIGVLIATVSDNAGGLAAALTWIEAQGAIGVAAFIGLYVLGSVLMMPGAALTIAAGAIYGLTWGCIYVSIGSTLGALVPFFIARHGARAYAERLTKQHPKVQALNNAVENQGWKIIALARLSPVLPYNLLNYAFGLSRVSLWEYCVASWIGMIPGTILYVYVGAVAGSLANTNEQSSLQRTFFWLGIVASAALFYYVTKITKRELAKLESK